MAVWFAAATLERCLFEVNTAPVGGGLGVQSAGEPVIVRDSTFLQNTGTIVGGGASLLEGSVEC